MSYFVMFINGNDLYMAADHRVSTRGNGQLSGCTISNYADTAEKLCPVNYRARNGRDVTIGISIMSGAASFNYKGDSLSVTAVVKSFLKRVEQKDIHFNSAVDANKELLTYAIKRYPGSINKGGAS